MQGKLNTPQNQVVETHLKFSMLTLLAIADRLVDLLNLLLLPAII